MHPATVPFVLELLRLEIADLPIHGLFYPDGTIRDPAAIAAVMGF